MAGEIAALGVKLLYCPESTAGTRPTTGYKEKATAGTLALADYITGITGLTSDIETAEVTPISTPQYGRRQFIPTLYGNDGNIKLNCNINPTSRSDWNAICTEHAALTSGKSFWWQVVLPGDTQGYFFRGEPVPMQMPDLNVGEAVQGEVQIVESDNDGWQTASIPSA